MAKFSKRSKDALAGVHPDLVRVMEAAIEAPPVDFTIVEGVRTVARQKQLYAQGRTTSGPVVTYADGVKKKSEHQPKADGYGHAVDIYPFHGGKIQFNDVAGLKALAIHIKAVAACLGVSITWGGDWKRPYDPPHFQV